MSLSFRFFADPALTTPIVGPLVVAQDVVSPAPIKRVIYFGSASAGHVAMDSVAPGYAQISVLIDDAAGDAGPGVGDVRLALSAAALDDAVPGDPLEIGPSVTGGAAGAVAIHLMVGEVGLGAGRYDDLSIRTSTIAEFS